MGILTATSFVTLDGVMQAPGGRDEDRSGGFEHGGWFVPYVADEAFGARIDEIFGRAEAFLLGRRTWEVFASYWPQTTDPGTAPVAGPLNRLPKHVATRTLERLGWAGSTPVRDAAAEVPALKARYAGELQVHGSPGLLQTLLGAGLVDVLHLVVAPVVLGAGKRLFGPGVSPAAFALEDVRGTASGLVLQTYRRRGRPEYGTIGS